MECKPTLSFHPLQGAEKWLRDPFATSGISLNVSSCWYHYPQLRSLCWVRILITEAIAPVSSFIIAKIPLFWLLAIVQTLFKNASCHRKEKSCRRYSTSVGLPKTVPCREEGSVILRLSVGSICRGHLQRPELVFCFFLRILVCALFDQTSRRILISAVLMPSTGLLSRYITAWRVAYCHSPTKLLDTLCF
jgi:hypothetical protein